MNKKIFKKIINKNPVFSIITPFKKNGAIDYETLFLNLKFYYANGVRVFYLMLYNSRLGLLNDKEIYLLNIKIARYLKKIIRMFLFFGREELEGQPIKM